MAELATIARPYAEALFRVAETGDLASWSTFVEELAQERSGPVKVQVTGPWTLAAAMEEAYGRPAARWFCQPGGEAVQREPAPGTRRPPRVPWRRSSLV